MKIEIPYKRYRNPTMEEHFASYSLRDDPTIIIESAEKCSTVLVWDREDIFLF